MQRAPLFESTAFPKTRLYVTLTPDPESDVWRAFCHAAESARARSGSQTRICFVKMHKFNTTDK